MENQLVKMELPKIFRSWVDFAKHCEKNFADKKLIIVNIDNKVFGFPIEKIKENAFDEIRRRHSGLASLSI